MKIQNLQISNFDTKTKYLTTFCYYNVQLQYEKGVFMTNLLLSDKAILVIVLEF